jgi:hypothetical protein
VEDYLFILSYKNSRPPKDNGRLLSFLTLITSDFKERCPPVVDKLSEMSFCGA